MDLRDYVRVLRGGWIVIAAFTVIGAALGAAVTLVTTRVYEASAQIFVATSSTQDPTQLNQGQTFAADRVQSYTTVVNGPAVTDYVVRSQHLNLTPQQLADKISADAPVNTVLINIHVADTDRAFAARIANAVAARFSDVIENQIEQTGADGKPVVKLTVVHPALVPVNPVKPNKKLNLGLGVLLGLLLGFAVALVRNILDNTVKGPRDFEDLGIPVLGMIPYDKRTPKAAIAFRADPHSSRSEAYRLLRTNLQFVNVDHAPRIIAVTSAVPGEGKTTTALNLASALAEAGVRVCLIEADLRRPTIAKTLGLSSEVGFTTVLIGRARVETVLQNAGKNLAVMTSGPIPPNPSELLISDHARVLIRAISERVDITIIDTAPLLAVADGAEVAAIADATLVVHQAGKTTFEQAARCVAALDKVGERAVGVVLNMVTKSGGDAYDVGYYYYNYRPAASANIAAEPQRTQPTRADDARAEVSPSA